MAPQSQKADKRPISFVLHDTSKGAAPVEVGLVIRPEDLTRTDTSRLNTVQTLGGAWIDNFGPGIPVVQLAGHTGWGAGDRPDGLAEFQKLHDAVFKQWHALRAEAVKSGLDPDKVKLIFADGLDDFTWVVAPQNFILKRNRSRPLLAQYQINLSWVSDDVAETIEALNAAKANALFDSLFGGGGKANALSSLAASVEKIKSFASDLKGKIGAFLGPIQTSVNKVVGLTATVLSTVQDVLGSVKSVSAELTNGLVGIATSLSRAAANTINTIHAITSLPMQIKAQFQRAGAAFENVFCLLSNGLRSRKTLQTYDDLYGASLCSSTAGGRPISAYDTENPFPVLLPVNNPLVSVSSTAKMGLTRLLTTDPVLAPLSSNDLGAALSAVGDGIKVAA
jgi:hypothetical protein